MTVANSNHAVSQQHQPSDSSCRTKKSPLDFSNLKFYGTNLGLYMYTLHIVFRALGHFPIFSPSSCCRHSGLVNLRELQGNVQLHHRHHQSQEALLQTEVRLQMFLKERIQWTGQPHSRYVRYIIPYASVGQFQFFPLCDRPESMEL